MAAQTSDTPTAVAIAAVLDAMGLPPNATKIIEEYEGGGMVLMYHYSNEEEVVVMYDDVLEMLRKASSKFTFTKHYMKVECDYTSSFTFKFEENAIIVSKTTSDDYCVDKQLCSKTRRFVVDRCILTDDGDRSGSDDDSSGSDDDRTTWHTDSSEWPPIHTFIYMLCLVECGMAPYELQNPSIPKHIDYYVDEKRTSGAEISPFFD